MHVLKFKMFPDVCSVVSSTIYLILQHTMNDVLSTQKLFMYMFKFMNIVFKMFPVCSVVTSKMINSRERMEPWVLKPNNMLSIYLEESQMLE